MQYGRYNFNLEIEDKGTDINGLKRTMFMKYKIEVLDIVPEDDLEIPNTISTIGIMYELKKVK